MENLKKLLEYIIGEISGSDSIETIDITENDKRIVFKVTAKEMCIGKLIGKNGSTATAIRQVMQAAAVKENVAVDVYFS